MTSTMTDVPTGTAAGGVADYTAASTRDTTRAASLRVDYLRTNVDSLGGEVQELHGEAREADLRARAFEKGRSSVSSLLEELAYDRGLGWSDIASLVGVSVSAVRKWRNGGDASPERRAVLARLAAFLDVIEDKGLVEDPARWMEMKLPLPSGYSIRPIDLYRAGHATALIDLAEQRRSVEHVLDDVRPSWRDARSQLEVFEDSDGQRSLRLRSQ